MSDGFGVSALDGLAKTAVHDVVDDGCAGVSGDIGCVVCAAVADHEDLIYEGGGAFDHIYDC